ncbi:MAG: hypothetical protein ABEJ58_04450 [Halodesulfurarchaeum sp.]
MSIFSVFFVVPAAAHAGSLNLSAEPEPIPRWVYAVSGGGVVGISFLFSALVTDREVVHGLRDRRVAFPSGGRLFRTVGRVLGVGVLLAVLVVGFFGPDQAVANLAVLVVWVGWWAGYTMSTYLVGNSWPWLNPWRTITSFFPTLDRSYPEEFGRYPAVLGLVALVYLEVVTPLADNPSLLASVILVYSTFTLIGAALFGPGDYFSKIDPVANVFSFYGRLAPLQWSGDRPTLVAPTGMLSEGTVVEGRDDIAFVISLLWVTTFDGLVSTPWGVDMIRFIVGLGVPVLLTYAVVLIAGLFLFFGAYELAVRGIRWSANTFVSRKTIALRFAPTLLPIAGAYHLAHFLGYFLELAPALLSTLFHPLSAVSSVPVLVLPDWFGMLALLFVIVGHVIAVWAAHGTAFDVFTGRVQPIRSQYPLALLMMAYTMTSMWIVSQPIRSPPFV